MDVTIGHEYLAPDLDHPGQTIRVRVVEFGAQDDAAEVLVEGKPVPRDVAHVMYLAGDREGTFGKVLYEHFEPLPTD